MHLSYLIKKNKKGNYLHFKIEGNGKTIKELEKNEKIDKNLLRYLTVKVKKLDLKQIILKKMMKTKKINIKYEKKNIKKKNTQNNFSKLSVFQNQKYKFKKKCPLSGKGAPIN